MQSQIFSHAAGDIIKIDLALDCVGVLPRLCRLGQPFQEEIHELRIGHLNGRFTMSFLDTNMNKVEIKTLTNYFLDIDGPVTTAWRNITIDAVDTPTTFTQFEQIDLFDSEAEAAEDLRAKSAVFHQSAAEGPVQAFWLV